MKDAKKTRADVPDEGAGDADAPPETATGVSSGAGKGCDGVLEAGARASTALARGPTISPRLRLSRCSARLMELRIAEAPMVAASVEFVLDTFRCPPMAGVPADGIPEGAASLPARPGAAALTVIVVPSVTLPTTAKTPPLSVESRGAVVVVLTARVVVLRTFVTAPVVLTTPFTESVVVLRTPPAVLTVLVRAPVTVVPLLVVRLSTGCTAMVVDWSVAAVVDWTVAVTAPVAPPAVEVSVLVVLARVVVRVFRAGVMAPAAV